MASFTTRGVHAVLPEIPIFRFMPPDVRTLVVASLEPLAYDFGQVIVREGEEADAFYVIVTGAARAVKIGENGDEVPLERLGPGDSFGFVELIEETPRVATVRASGAVQALRLDRAVFNGLLRSNPEIRRYFDLPRRLYHLRHFLRTSTVFADLSDASLQTLLDDVREENAPAGTVVCREGEAAAAAYAIRSGRAQVTENGTPRSFLREGDVFGERALIAGEPRAASVTAVDDLRLITIPAATFQKLLASDEDFRRRVEERAAAYDYKQQARVPLDFQDEILPAASGIQATLEGTEPLHASDAAEDSVDADMHARAPSPGARSRKRIKKFPHVHQLDEADCGAACVAMVCRYFGREVSLPYVRDTVNTSLDGTSLAGITRGAEEIGLAARALKASKSRLDDLPLPAIVHWKGNHWMVLFDVEPKRVRVSDPATGVKWIPRDEFEADWSGYTALMDRTPKLDDAPVVKASFGWLRTLLRPHRGAFIRAFLLALLAAGFQMLIPIFSQVIVDRVITDGDRAILSIIVAAMAVVIVLMIVTSVIQRYILSKTAVRIDGASLDFLTSKLLALPMSYFHSRRTGDIERRLAGMRQIRELLVQNGVQALTAVTQLAVAIVVMFVYSWVLAFVYLATVPFYAGLLRYSRKKLRPTFDTLEEAFGRYESRQIDAIKGIETVKAIGAEPQLRGAPREAVQRAAAEDLPRGLHGDGLRGCSCRRCRCCRSRCSCGSARSR